MNELTPFECSKCHCQKCKVIPVLPRGLMINCSECGFDIGIVELTKESFEMLLQAEKEYIEEELLEESSSSGK